MKFVDSIIFWSLPEDHRGFLPVERFSLKVSVETDRRRCDAGRPDSSLTGLIGSILRCSRWANWSVKEGIIVELIIKLILSPLAFALGFIWPLITQSLVALQWLPAGPSAVLAGALVATTLGLVAQFRGSWIWVK